MAVYTAKTGFADLKKFNKEIGQFYNQEIIQRVPHIVKFSAAVTIHQLLKRSPVFTGSYILSHQLTKHYIGATYTIRKPITDPSTGQEIRQSKSRMRRKARTRLFKKLRSIPVRFGGKNLQLNNSIPYAGQVEYGFATGKSGYRVYGQAYENARMALNRLLGSIQTIKWDKPKDSLQITAVTKRELAETKAAIDAIGDIVGEREQMARDLGYKVD